MASPVVEASRAVASIAVERSAHFRNFNQIAQMILANDTARPAGIDQAELQAFVRELCESGYVEKTGTDQEARPIAVTAQGSLEETLTRMCSSKEISDVEAYFLTPLPTTPLRKKGETQQLSTDFFEDQRQYTLDLREHTVRGLREHAMINVAYNSEKCAALDGAQAENWRVEKEHSNVRDLPTDKQIPAELVGAAYTWKAAGESFLIITQGVQAKDAADGATTWKLWFEKVGLDGPGEQRFAQVKDFIQ